jgi:hypothetical protein
MAANGILFAHHIRTTYSRSSAHYRRRYPYEQSGYSGYSGYSCFKLYNQQGTIQGTIKSQNKNPNEYLEDIKKRIYEKYENSSNKFHYMYVDIHNSTRFKVFNVMTPEEISNYVMYVIKEEYIMANCNFSTYKNILEAEKIYTSRCLENLFGIRRTYSNSEYFVNGVAKYISIFSGPKTEYNFRQCPDSDSEPEKEKEKENEKEPEPKDNPKCSEKSSIFGRVKKFFKWIFDSRTDNNTNTNTKSIIYPLDKDPSHNDIKEPLLNEVSFNF